MWKTLLGLGMAGLVVFSLWWVQAPPRGETAYRESAQTTLKKLRSRTETARLWVVQLERDNVHTAAVEVALEEADHGASSALAQFEGYDPPRGLEALRADVVRAGEDTTARLTELRIAAHDGRWEELTAVAEPLTDIAARLQDVSAEAEP